MNAEYRNELQSFLNVLSIGCTLLLAAGIFSYSKGSLSFWVAWTGTIFLAIVGMGATVGWYYMKQTTGTNQESDS